MANKRTNAAGSETNGAIGRASPTSSTRMRERRLEEKKAKPSVPPPGKKGMTPREEEALFSAASTEYKVVSDRNDTLTNRAQAMLGFGGIVNVILVALIMQVTDDKVRAYLQQYVNSSLLTIFVVGGFIFYSLSVLFSLVAFRTKKYIRAPNLGSEFLGDVVLGKTKLDMGLLSRQLSAATEHNQELNNKKYDWLLAATVFLLVAIVFTAVVGIILFLPLS